MEWDDFFEKLSPIGNYAGPILEMITKYKWYIVGGTIVLIYVVMSK